MGLILLSAILVNIGAVQTFLAKKAAAVLAKKLETKVSIKNVQIHFLNRASLEEVYIEDQYGDTLLYSGSVHLKITDWFIFVDKPVIRYIGLENAYVTLQRHKDTDQWNYQFIIDAFAQPNARNKKPNNSDFEFDLKRAELKNVHFQHRDAWVGSDIGGSVKELYLNAKNIDFKNKIIDLKSISADGVDFGLLEYTGGRPKELSPPTNKYEIDPTPFNTHNWAVQLGELRLKNNRFFLEYPETEAPEGLFDENHLDIQKINLYAKDLKIIGDTITANVQDLQAKERCGLEIKEMKALVTVSPVISECKNLYLVTGNSILQDYYSMNYERFPDFTEYIDKVKMIGHLKNAEIGIQDIVYFAPELKRFANLSVKVSGNGNGTVARLNGDDIIVQDGFSTLKGDLTIDGLPNIQSTFFDLRNLDLKTSGAATFFYLPELKTQTIANLKILNQIDFKGNLTGFLSDFVTYGTFQTNLGFLKADFNVKIPDHHVPAYSGNLFARDFDIGALFYQEFAGAITFSADVKGRGLEQKDVDFDVDGKIDHFFINDYDYSNIVVNGKLKKKLFDGFLKIDDPHLDLDFTGKMDFSGEVPIYDFAAYLEYIDAKKLHLTEDDIKGNADMQLSLQGNNIDDFVGTASIFNVNLLRDQVKLNLDSIFLVSKVNGFGEKEISLSANQLFARVYGKYNLKMLPQSFQLFLSYYLPEYINMPAEFDLNQNFKFEILANKANDIISLFNKDIRLSDSTTIRGSLDLGEQQLIVKGSFPEFHFNKVSGKDIELDIAGDYKGLDIHAKTNEISAKEGNLISHLDFTSRVSRDSAYFKLLTSSLDNNIDKAELNGVAYAFQDKFFLNILNSEFHLNDHHWEIAKGNQFVFSNDNFSVSNLKLSSDHQSIMVNPDSRNAGQGNAFIQINQFDLHQINQFLNWEAYEIDGLVSGTIDAKSVFKSLQFDFDLHSEHTLINSDTIGNVVAMGSFDLNNKMLDFKKGSGLTFKGSRANVSMKLDFKDGSKNGVEGEINLQDAQIAWSQPFLKGLVSDITGTLNGHLLIAGALDQFYAKGKLKIKDAGFKPDIIGVHYQIKEGEIDVISQGFDLGSQTVYDDFGNKGNLSGSITHNQLSDFRFNVRFNSDYMQVVNLKSYESERFYGNIFASFQTQVTGPFEDLNMNVFATPKGKSSLIIPIDYGSDLGTYNYITFKQQDAKDSFILKPLSYNKINFRLDAVATPDLETTIILDASSGDRIVAKGSGNVILEIPPNDELKMNGNYIIDQGTYDFSFKQLQVLNYKRQFNINPNSSIKWNGDITDADLDVSAYTTVKARLYDLIQGEVDRLTPLEIKDAQIAQSVHVEMKMKGSLSEPDLKFNIDLVEGRSIGTYGYQRLQRINSDEKELLNQVASLLLLDRFMPPEGINNSAISSGTINNMSELLSSALSSQITNFANNVFGMSDLSIDIKYKNYSLANSDPLTAGNYFNRNEAGLNLKKNFFNNRLIVEVGGVYDWGRTARSTTFQDNIAGDFRLQYLLSQDGRIRLNVFRNSNFDALSLQNISRQGIGINYRKSFNDLFDLFNISRNKKYLSPIKENNQLPELKKENQIGILEKEE